MTRPFIFIWNQWLFYKTINFGFKWFFLGFFKNSLFIFDFFDFVELSTVQELQYFILKKNIWDFLFLWRKKILLKNFIYWEKMFFYLFFFLFVWNFKKNFFAWVFPSRNHQIAQTFSISLFQNQRMWNHCISNFYPFLFFQRQI